MSYDHRRANLTPGNFDPSILGYSHSDIEKMDDEEREEAMVDCLNRAADLLENAVSAFYTQLEKGERSDLNGFADKVVAIARKR